MADEIIEGFDELMALTQLGAQDRVIKSVVTYHNWREGWTMIRLHSSLDDLLSVDRGDGTIAVYGGWMDMMEHPDEPELAEPNVDGYWFDPMCVVPKR
jgi:hypothetical protein